MKWGAVLLVAVAAPGCGEAAAGVADARGGQDAGPGGWPDAAGDGSSGGAAGSSSTGGGAGSSASGGSSTGGGAGSSASGGSGGAGSAVSLEVCATNRWATEPTEVSVTATRSDGQSTAELLGFSGSGTRGNSYAASGEYTLSVDFLGTAGALDANRSRPLEIFTHQPVDNGQDHLQLSTVSFIDPNISAWPATSTITGVSLSEQEICIYHTKASVWPDVDGVYGNPWVFAKLDGRWWGATFEWMRPGQQCKQLDPASGGTVADRIGPHIKREPLLSWVPKRGEVVGFMYSGLARMGQFDARSVEERSNVVLVEWPFGPCE